jgi:hypothetical protein
MDVDQLIFSEVIIEADECNRAAQDELRADVQRWFDQLTTPQKDALGGWMNGGAQYDTCVALSAAAGDWHYTRQQQLVKEWRALQRSQS